MKPVQIILASASPRRMDLLSQLGVDFIVLPSRAEELHDPKIPPAELCQLNAERKAAEVAELHPGKIVLGADTLVALDGRLYGKPRDLAEARQMLTELAGHTHEVITAVCLLEQSGGRRAVFAEKTLVTFKALTPAQIETYLRLVPVLDKAGAYGIQDKGEMLVERVAGSYSNVVGLPLERLAVELRRWGVPIKGARGKTAAPVRRSRPRR